MINPGAGVLLIAEPFLKDENFKRTILLLCRHSEEGSFGFVLNKPYEFSMEELFNDMEGIDIPVYVGGPVQMDTVHYIHQYPDLIPDSQRITDEIYWGGDFETVKQLLRDGLLDSSKIRFFIGYSGWEPRQLENEMDEKSWLTTMSNRTLVFETPMEEMWKASLKQLGGKYEMMINFPIDPQLN
jgi:putative transcriptional regulator